MGLFVKFIPLVIRGPLAEAISRGELEEPVQIHSHGGRANLIHSGELVIDVAFIGVPSCDEYGNANGYTGTACCGSLGYAKIDAETAKKVVMLTEEILDYPITHPVLNKMKSIISSKLNAWVMRIKIGQMQLVWHRTLVSFWLHVPQRMLSKNPVISKMVSHYKPAGGASLAVTRFLEDKM